METLSFKRGSFNEHSMDISAMFKEHWEEIAKNKHLMVLKPNYAAYKAMEDADKLIVIYAYDNEQVIGYSYSFLSYHLHYSDLLVAHNDLLYILPAYRNGSVGLRLIRMTEDEARKEGAQLMTWHAKEHTALANILPRMGNKVQEIIFSKEL